MGISPDPVESEAISQLGILSARGWLAEQPIEFQGWAARNGHWQNHEPGQVIYGVGEQPDGLYGLGEGAFEVTFPLIGDEPVPIYRAEPGSWIGDSAVFSETIRKVAVVSAAPSRIFRIPAVAMRDLVEMAPEHWMTFYQLSQINVIRVLTLLAEAMALSPKARLARLVQRLANAEGRAEVTQLELARLIGMTRSTMQRSIAALTESGAIETGYRTLTVRDAEALDRAAHDR